jgi:hypothetical protein
MAFVLEAEDVAGECDIVLGEDTGNTATMLCRQKRFDFFFAVVWIFILQLAGMIGLNLLILLWSFEATGWRSVTRPVNLNIYFAFYYCGPEVLFCISLPVSSDAIRRGQTTEEYHSQP